MYFIHQILFFQNFHYFFVSLDQTQFFKVWTFHFDFEIAVIAAHIYDTKISHSKGIS